MLEILTPSPGPEKLMPSGLPIDADQPFLREADRTLGLLRTTGARVSLFALSLDGPEAEAALCAVRRVLDPVAIAGRLPDGRLGIFYAGPRPTGGDGAVWGSLYKRLRGLLPDSLLAATYAGKSEVHAAAAALRGTADLIRLLDRPVR